jgi:hypothetical protein
MTEGEPEPRTQWHGMSFLRTQNERDARDVVNRVEMTNGADGVVYRTAGVGTGKEAEVSTRSAHVRAFLREVDEANRETSVVAIVPYTKQMQAGGGKKRDRRDPDELVRCPACEGNGWDDCVLCDGAGQCTDRAAKAFRAIH